MTTSALWVIFGIAVFYFGEVAFAIYRGRDFKASLKVPFALFTFETKETAARVQAEELSHPVKPSIE